MNRTHIVGHGDFVVVFGAYISQAGRRVAYDLPEGGPEVGRISGAERSNPGISSVLKTVG